MAHKRTTAKQSRNNRSELFKKQQHLLTPSVFLSSITQLNIIPQEKGKRESSNNPLTSPTTSNATLPTATIKGDTPQSLTTTTRNNDSSSSLLLQQEQVTFTNEAIESLRQCHGEFIALLASELAVPTSSSSSDGEEDDRGGEKQDYEGRNIKTKKIKQAKQHVVKPNDVQTALRNLDFHDILSKLGTFQEKISLSKLNLDNGSKSQCSAVTSNDNVRLVHDSTTAATNQNTLVGKRIEGKQQRKKRRGKSEFQKAFLNKKTKNALLLEQEELFQSSIRNVTKRMMQEEEEGGKK